MFSGCSSLQSVPLINFSATSQMNQMFQNCTSLKSVPVFNFTGAQNAVSLFSGCTSLKSVSFVTSSTLITTATMFSNCTSLTSVSLFNTQNVAAMNSMFQNCVSLTTVPLFNTASVTTTSNMFDTCTALTTVPGFTTTNMNNFGLMFNACPSLVKATLPNVRFAYSVASCKLSETELTSIIDNLGTANTQGLVLNISGNWGAVTPVAVTGVPTAGSTTITATLTGGVVAGMQWTGVGSPATTPIACTFTDAGDLVTKTAHGLSNGDRVSFATIVTTTGIVINRIYFVISATTDTFQVAATSGGAAVALTTNGTGTVRWESVVVSVITNTSITVSRPATATGSTALSFRTLKTQTALLKGWAVTG
jgi:surface protein